MSLGKNGSGYNEKIKRLTTDLKFEIGTAIWRTDTLLLFYDQHFYFEEDGKLYFKVVRFYFTPLRFYWPVWRTSQRSRGASWQICYQIEMVAFLLVHRILLRLAKKGSRVLSLGVALTFCYYGMDRISSKRWNAPLEISLCANKNKNSQRFQTLQISTWNPNNIALTTQVEFALTMTPQVTSVGSPALVGSWKARKRRIWKHHNPSSCSLPRSERPLCITLSYNLAFFVSVNQILFTCWVESKNLPPTLLTGLVCITRSRIYLLLLRQFRL